MKNLQMFSVPCDSDDDDDGNIALTIQNYFKT